MCREIQFDLQSKRAGTPHIIESSKNCCCFCEPFVDFYYNISITRYDTYMPQIMQYFIVFKAFKALSYWVFVLFYLFFPAFQKTPNKTQNPQNPLGWALKKTPGFFEPWWSSMQRWPFSSYRLMKTCSFKYWCMQRIRRSHMMRLWHGVTCCVRSVYTSAG